MTWHLYVDFNPIHETTHFKMLLQSQIGKSHLWIINLLVVYIDSHHPISVFHNTNKIYFCDYINLNYSIIYQIISADLNTVTQYSIVLLFNRFPDVNKYFFLNRNLDFIRRPHDSLLLFKKLYLIFWVTTI